MRYYDFLADMWTRATSCGQTFFFKHWNEASLLQDLAEETVNFEIHTKKFKPAGAHCYDYKIIYWIEVSKAREHILRAMQFEGRRIAERVARELENA